MFDFIKTALLSCAHFKKMWSASHAKKYREEQMQADIIRNVHSIEKGMCTSACRLGYGIPKISSMLDEIETYRALGFDPGHPSIQMAKDALHAYLAFHLQKEFTSDEYEALASRIWQAFPDPDQGGSGYGGVRTVCKKAGCTDTFEEVLHGRHSLRDYSNEPVDVDLIKKAIGQANACPSACNRQTSRVYIVGREQADVFSKWMEGTGDFFCAADKALVITGKMSMYEAGEIYQYAVNAGIFTGYLTLALQAAGIASCVIQRPQYTTRSAERLSKMIGIPDDEHIVCMMTLGKPKDTCKAPVSYRMGADLISRVV
jgi:nitroreductase